MNLELLWDNVTMVGESDAHAQLLQPLGPPELQHLGILVATEFI